MSKSSKARKRVIKMIRAEASILGESNMAYDDYKKDFHRYCNEKILYYKGIYTNKELLGYYKQNIIPQLNVQNYFDIDLENAQNVFASAGITCEELENKWIESGKIMRESMTKS